MVERSISPADPIALANPSVLGQFRSVEIQASDDRTPRGHRERHAKKEWSAKARNHPRVASALPHSEGIAYKPLCGEIAMCSRVGRMGSIK